MIGVFEEVLKDYCVWKIYADPRTGPKRWARWPGDILTEFLSGPEGPQNGQPADGRDRTDHGQQGAHASRRTARVECGDREDHQLAAVGQAVAGGRVEIGLTRYPWALIESKNNRR